MKSGVIDKFLERFKRLPPEEAQIFLGRLAQEKGFLQQVFEALQEGLIVADAEGRIVYLNSASCRLFGADHTFPPAEVSSLIHGLDWELLVAGNGVVSRDMEIFYPENRFLNFYFKPLQTPHQRAYVMLIRDLTQTRRQTEEMIESERLNALTMLAAGVAHELGNPLNSLNIHLQLLDRQLKKASPKLKAVQQMAERLDIARGEIKRLDYIIGQFLGALRPTQLRVEIVDINQLVQETLAVMAPDIEDRGLRQAAELRSALPLLHLDAGQMKQALFNLLKNAVEACTPGGGVHIHTDYDDNEVTVAVSDTGGGISDEQMSHLFEPYRTTKKSGSGLGLLIVRRIVREHGGELEFQSEPGLGTKVTIHLPRSQRAIRFLGN